MPRVQVYLPDDLYAELKQRKLPASELLQEAVRTEVRRQKLIDEADAYLKEAIDKYGEPDPEDIAWAQDLVRGIKEHRASSAAKQAAAAQRVEKPSRRKSVKKAS
jgi:post-segregation antitoxin (ccd killing protein)